jgi:hypothetical protein
LIEKSFSLTIEAVPSPPRLRETSHLYLSIPWDLCHQSVISNPGLPQPGKCCKSAVSAVAQSITAGYTGFERAQNTEAFFVDQDLQITRKKILTSTKLSETWV